ncbi:MAG: hypothetical protein H6585_10300 [Flavobacteriales bacterium]|nr:hypothetical protein [Flavobacteriales bacterium]MCB9448722.1 hypothetical protein [Flavobacteriales bacterium]
MKTSVTSLLAMACLATTLLTSCKKETDPHIPPDVVFKTGAGYTSSDATVGMNDTLLVGITATKTEDDLKSYNISYAYDGTTTTTTFYNYLMQASEYTGYSKDTTLITRNTAGTEKWVFSIVDRDGNITQLTLNLTVQ